MPPFIGVAVNVTGVPAQLVVLGVVMLIAGVSIEATFIVIKLDAAVAGEGQTALEVIITVTTSPLVNVEEFSVGEFVPTLIPFTCH